MKAKIHEIFRSVQGEGKYAGIPQVFVRFFGCHMHCIWCDTPEAIGDGAQVHDEMTADEVCNKIEGLNEECFSVSLTGGEPLMQSAFIKQILPFLKKNRYPVYLETSGVLYKNLAEIISGVDVVSMDMKLPSSTQQKSFWKEHKEFLEVARGKDLFIKIVISQGTSEEDMKQAADIIRQFNKATLTILQPNTYELNTRLMDEVMALQKICLNQLTDVRILPQMHKMLGLR